VFAKGAGFGSVKHVDEAGSDADLSERRVEEARPYGAVGFDNSGGPRGVADWRGEFRKPERSAEMSGQAAHLLGRFANEAAALAAGNQGFDLRFEGAKVVERQGYVVVDYAQAVGRPVEGFGVRIDGEEGDRIDIEQTCGAHGFDDEAAVGSLDRAPG